VNGDGGLVMELRIQNASIDQGSCAEITNSDVIRNSSPKGRKNPKEWTLSHQSFDLLLSALHEDRECAGEEYERLRRTLVTFFDWRGCAFPEELADETFNRASRRLEEGEPIRNLADYCHGVARRMVFEVIPSQNKIREAPEDFKDLPANDEAIQERYEYERRFELFERCLGKLPSDERELIVNYYRTERRAKIDNRVAIAQSLGISLNNLRVRVYRIRAKLESCIKDCNCEGLESEYSNR
jgi:RNA polymerase sigma factor (sigma-70 family)